MTAKIASIHFAPLIGERSIYGGFFSMPAVSLDAAPAILVLNDKVQRDEGPITTGPGGGQREKKAWPVYGEEIAVDLISQWSLNGLGMTPDCRPGIWQVRERIPVMKIHEGREVPELDVFGHQIFRGASEMEQKAMWNEDLELSRRADRAYADWCFIDGNRIAADARLIRFIPPNYKLAARQYGHQAEWLKEGAAYAVMPCPHCTTIVPKTAMMCPKCSQPIDLQRYAQWEMQKAIAMATAQNHAKGGGLGGYGKDKEKDKVGV